MTLGIQICFSSVLRVGQSPLLNRAFRTLSRKTLYSHYTNLHGFCGSLLWSLCYRITTISFSSFLSALFLLPCTRSACWFGQYVLQSKHFYFHIVIIGYKRRLSNILSIERGRRRRFLYQIIQHSFLVTIRNVLQTVVCR